MGELSLLFGHFLVQTLDFCISKHLQEYDKELEEVLSPSDYLQFLRRWNMLMFKIEEARGFLSLQDYYSSFQFVQSLRYDVTALHKLVHSAGKHIQTVLICEKV